MSDTIPTPAKTRQTPRERLTRWDTLLRQHGWTTTITATDQRARLDAHHPTGAAVMATAGSAGRTTSDKVNLYALNPEGPGVQGWITVRVGALEKFAAKPQKNVKGPRTPSKCQCRSANGRRKLRYPVEQRARMALLETAISRELRHRGRRAERRVYRCPDDDRVWHLSSRPQWQSRPGESPLWSGEGACA